MKNQLHPPEILISNVTVDYLENFKFQPIDTPLSVVVIEKDLSISGNLDFVKLPSDLQKFLILHAIALDKHTCKLPDHNLALRGTTERKLLAADSVATEKLFELYPATNKRKFYSLACVFIKHEQLGLERLHPFFFDLNPKIFKR